MKKFLSFILILCLLIPCAASAQADSEEFVRGVWVSSVANLDYPSSAGLSDDQLRAEADKIIANCVEMGMNTIFFQVRPCSDALYNSSIFPKSVFLTGESSFEELTFDPLSHMVEKAHENGIGLHAWLNPYRVTRLSGKELEKFSPDSPQRLHPEYLLQSANGNYFFNPALPEVRDLITAGIVEILENYDVDGIHFDDYFYPESSFDDSELFAASGYSDIDEWRTENVNALVKQVSETVHSYGVPFGISPRGIWANNYNDPRGSATRGGGSLTDIYCDSLRFIEEGWVDYICPQIYWNIGNSIADYSILVPWWADAVSAADVKLYIGMADYRVAESGPGSVWTPAELGRQLELNKSYPEVSGEVHFRYGSLADNSGLFDLYKENYAAPAESSVADIGPQLRVNLLRILIGLIFTR